MYTFCSLFAIWSLRRWKQKPRRAAWLLPPQWRTQLCAWFPPWWLRPRASPTRNQQRDAPL